ncbi:TatD family hydrolase [Haploplasma axanthum]|uniref:TatD family deoxyribonuclease n=1 Tax=Haploplasma axanthum TaxID=29552 RepID=A0A449BD16_HAPAX|nr:TatD family hydrolase [Haploplasma axanthum]VEU80210.1 TatD family deoxyribonuclease [Haploplasma axanthum]
MIDTHAHLNVSEYNDDVNDVVKRAKENQVKKIIVVGMDHETSLKAIELSTKYQELYATVGIHPGYVNDSDHMKLNGLYNNKKVIAVGEIGLDYYWTDDNRELQEKIFEEQIQKAILLNLPVIIHTRNSFNEAYEIVKKYQGKVRGVFHCFSSNYIDALKAIELGFFIGVDGPITFKNNQMLVEIVQNIPLENLLIETDSPYLTPIPFRGKRNEPANVYYVAQKIAEIKNISFDEVKKVTTNNAVKLFNLRGDK